MVEGERDENTSAAGPPSDDTNLPGASESEGIEPGEAGPPQESSEPQTPPTNKPIIDQIRMGERWMIGLTALIGVTGVIGTVIFGSQLHVMQGQLDVMKAANEAERPWLGVSRSSIPLPRRKPTRASITVVNAGKSPARILTFDLAEGTYPTIPVRTKFAHSLGSIDSREVVVPGQSVSEGLIVAGVSSDQLTFVEHGKLKAYVFGLVVYEDVIHKETHSTAICFVYVPARVEWDYCSEHNDAD